MKRRKDRIEEIKFHEIDHCATMIKREALSFSKEKQNELLNIFCSDYIAKNPQILDMKSEQQVKKEILDEVLKKNPVLTFVGIDNGNNWLTQLNEGITTLKEKKCCEELGIKFGTGYVENFKLAECISKVIGEKELVKSQFYNDYQSIEQKFNKKTGENLSELVDILNKMRSKYNIKNPLIKRVVLKVDRISKKYFPKNFINNKDANEFNTRINRVEDMMEITSIKPKRDISFIPKVEVPPLNLDRKIENRKEKVVDKEL